MIEIPFDLPGTERAALELQNIRGEFTATQRAVIDLAAKSETGKKAFDHLVESFGKGEIAAKDVRESLAKIAAQAPKTGAEVAKAAKEAEEALEKQKKAAEELAAKQRTLTGGFRDTSLASGRTNESMASLGGTVTGVTRGLGVAAVAVAAVIAGLVKFGEAAAQGDRQAAALRSLGATYDQVSRATNDTVTATDVLAARQTFLNSRLRISGTELASVARYAREHKQAGESAADATRRLSEALSKGEAEGLRSFGLAVQSGATRAQTFERALQTMRTEQERNAPASRTLAEDTDRLKEALGEGGSALARMAADGLGLQSVISDLATGIRGVARDIHEMIDAANQAPAQQDAFQRRQRSLDGYITALRTARQEAERLGLDRTALPSVNPNQLTDAQRDAATARLQALATSASARRAPAATTDTIVAGAHDALAFGAGRTSFNVSTDDASLSAMAAGLQAARSTRRGGDARVAQDRAEVRRGLGSLDRELDAQVAANQRALRQTTPQGPRDGAPAGAAQSQVDQQAIQALQRRVTLARQGYQDERENIASVNTLREREMALLAGSAESEQQRFDAARRIRYSREEDLRTLNETEARQVQGLATLREGLATERAHTTSVAQRRALDDQIHTLREDELRLTREIATNQAEIAAAEAEGARAAREHAAELARKDLEQQRQRNAAYARTDEGGLAERRRDLANQREARQQEQRIERLRGFNERWREAHDEQVDITAQTMGTLEHAITSGGAAIGAAWEQIVTGQASVADALQKGLSDWLLSIAKRESVEGGVEIAKGVSALAGVVTAPLAPGHFAAAAAHFAVAAATGLGGAALAPSTGGAGGGAGRAASAPRDAPLQRREDARGGGAGGNTYNFTFGGGMLMGTPRELTAGIMGLLNDPANGAQLNSRRVGGRA